MVDPVLPANAVEQYVHRRLRIFLGQHLAIVGKDLLGYAMRSHRGHEAIADQLGSLPRHQPRRHAKPGVVVDAGAQQTPVHRRLRRAAVTCLRTNSRASRRAPQYRCARRSSSTRTSISAGIWWGHRAGRWERSGRPSSPSASYRANQRCTVRRLTPHWLATSMTARPSERTPRTTWYRCSATLISLMGDSETHQPK